MHPSVPSVSPEAREQIIAMIMKGKVILAVKHVRDVTGADLKPAKLYVDSLKGEAISRMVPFDVQEEARALIAQGRRKDAVKLVRRGGGVNARYAKDFVAALRDGRELTAPASGPGTLSARVRACLDAGDHHMAITLVCAETGMRQDEAQRFVESLR